MEDWSIRDFPDVSTRRNGEPLTEEERRDAELLGLQHIYRFKKRVGEILQTEGSPITLLPQPVTRLTSNELRQCVEFVFSKRPDATIPGQLAKQLGPTYMARLTQKGSTNEDADEDGNSGG